MRTNISEFKKWDRVAIHPGCDIWMRGIRYGVVAKIGRKYVHIIPDHMSDKSTMAFHPCYLTKI